MSRHCIIYRVYDKESKGGYVNFNRRDTALEYLEGELRKEFDEPIAKSIYETVRRFNTNGRFSITEVDMS